MKNVKRSILCKQFNYEVDSIRLLKIYCTYKQLTTPYQIQRYLTFKDNLSVFNVLY